MIAPRTIGFVAVLLIGFAADQASKAWVVGNLRLGLDEVTLIPGFLSFVHAQNDGAAFSMMEGQQTVFLVFTVVALLVIGDMFRKLAPHQAFMGATLGLLLSGVLGNALDRVRMGYVTDFVRVYTEYPPLENWLIANAGTNTWPIFNIADAALLVGVAVYLMRSMFVEESAPEAISEDALADEQDDAPEASATAEAAD
jgi:signal peptidase II